MSAATDLATYDELQRENERATRRLLTASVALTVGLLWLVGLAYAGPFVFDIMVFGGLLLLALVVGIGLVAVVRFRAPRTALRLAGARPLAPDEAPHLRNVFAEVCASAGLSGAPPTLHVVDDPAPNAFAAGLSDHGGHVVVTRGLIDLLPRYELRAVLAHEVAHITNDDVRATTLAVATAGTVTRITDAVLRSWERQHRRRVERGKTGVWTLLWRLPSMPFTSLLRLGVRFAPSWATLIRSSVSRHREFLADAAGAEIVRDPQSMVDALRRIEAAATPLARFELTTAHLWFTEPQELHGAGPCPRTARAYATHPPLRERIERLARLHGGTVTGSASGSPPPQGPPLPPPAR